MKASLFLSFLLIFIALGAWNPKKEVKKLRTKMKRIVAQSKIQNKRLRMKASQIKEVSDKLAMNNHHIQEVSDNLSINKDLIEEVSDDLAINKDQIQEVSDSLTPLIDPPYLYTCGYQSGFYSTNQIVNYDRLLINYTNIVSPGGIELQSGVFNSPLSAVYTVQFTARSIFEDLSYHSGEEQILIMYLRNNGSIMYETFELNFMEYVWSSSYMSPGSFGREIIVYLAAGDYIDLYCADCSTGINNINFCITLNQQVNSTSSIMNWGSDKDETAEDKKNNRHSKKYGV